MRSDARNGAWLAAWELLEAVNKLKIDRKGTVIEPLPELYWALLAEASVFAELARAPMDIGFCVGDWLERREREERDQRERIERAFAETRGGES